MIDIKLELNKIQGNNSEFVLFFIKNYTFHLFFDNEIELSNDFIKKLNHKEQQAFVKIIRKIKNTKKEELINLYYLLAKSILNKDHLTKEIEISSTKIYSEIENALINVEKESTKQQIDPPSKIECSKLINPIVIPVLQKVTIDSQLNENLTFDNFIEGETNRLARSAGKAIAKRLGGTSFNPLFIHGGVGLGKTHLAHAIGLEVKEKHPEKTVLYVGMLKFIQQYAEASHSNNRNDFIHFYQMIDVLIIDDVQFLSGKKGTQDVFFHIFNVLHQRGHQLVLTSDKAPVDIQDMEKRLISRFKLGLSVDLQAPDYNTRVKILKHILAKDGVEMDNDIIEYIAKSIKLNVRELEAILISLFAQTSIYKKNITLDLAEKTLTNFIESKRKEISIDYIQNVICDYFKIPLELVQSNTRKRYVVEARQLAMFFAKQYTNASLASIGNQMGNINSKNVENIIKNVEVDIKFKKAKEELTILFKQ